MTHFRNLLPLDLDLPPGMVVLQGENAQGKTNLLEAVFLLATARSHRTANDGELLCWTVLEEEMPYARLVGEFRGAAGPLSVELVVMGQPQGGAVAGEGQVSRVQKRLRINGVARRALDLLGQVPVVLFSPEEVDLVAGAPTLRRRYLDLLLSQLDPQYARTLQRYQRVLLQRNHLLRLIREGQASTAELAFWDDELVQAGSYLLRGRIEAIAVLEQEAQRIHAELTDGQERLGLAYQSALAPESADPSTLLRTGPSTKFTPSILSQSQDEGLRTKPSLDAMSARFRAALAEVQRREIAQGQSVRGPHRDDVRFSVDGADMGVYGSRGQQRTAVLSLKLAEAVYLEQRLGEPPLLLLDDVLSELDESRRAYLLRAAARLPQCLITTTGADPLALGGAPPAARFRVHAGSVTRG